MKINEHFAHIGSINEKYEDMIVPVTNAKPGDIISIRYKSWCPSCDASIVEIGKKCKKCGKKMKVYA